MEIKKSSKTNSLTSHWPERNSHRVDKMSGLSKKWKKRFIGSSKKFYKKFANKKRRQYLKKYSE